MKISFVPGKIVVKKRQRLPRKSKPSRAARFTPRQQKPSPPSWVSIKATRPRKFPWAWVVLAGLVAVTTAQNSSQWKQASDRTSASRSLPPIQSIFGDLTKQDVRAGTEDLSKSTNFEAIDQAASLINYQGSSVSELAQILSGAAKTDSEKARIIFAWISRNIAYDVPVFLSGDYGSVDPETVLKERKSVCSGYANLYQALAQNMGLDATVIDGYAKGYSYTFGEELKVNHAWNGVKINGGWYLVDATWGAGHLEGSTFTPSFNSHYFSTSPQKFIVDHLPVSEKWQLLDKPISKEQYATSPRIHPQYFVDNLKLISHQKYLIESKGNTDIVLEAPEDVTLMASLGNMAGTLDPRLVTIRHNGQYVYITVAIPAKGDYELSIFSKRSVQRGSLPQAVSYGIRVN
jgi:transglutaminase/protease-like cytokinesis protein 3